MRLRWESATPLLTATRLAGVLGVAVRHMDGSLAIDLGDGLLEVTAGDEDAGVGERLRLRADGPGETPAIATTAAGPTVVGVGLATVDADRFALDRGWSLTRIAPDRILGAHVSAVDRAAQTLLLEPDTEGRIAASLARWGEGPAALYLRCADRIETARAAVLERGGGATALAAGPFGRAFALTGGPIWGPHVVVVESDAFWNGAGTIRA